MDRRLLAALITVLALPLLASCTAQGVGASGLGGEPLGFAQEPGAPVGSDGGGGGMPVGDDDGDDEDGDDRTEPGGAPGGVPDADAPSPTLPSAPPARPAPPADLAQWSEYRNDRLGFAVRYPPSYLIATETDQPRLQPPAVFRVEFQDRQLAGSPTAAFQPPQFAVTVYDNPSGESLEGWLRANSRLDPMALVEPVTIGGIAGVRVTGALLIAPNTFGYVARGPYVYEFTLLGEFSDQMLQTVAFL